GENPSYYQFSEDFKVSLLNPVDEVSWTDCVDTLARLGLILPTEAQWEYGKRRDKPAWSRG
ncbi:MAG: hypothetical protein ACYS0H_26015, partial [Planctomycetota bacterium]